jgi:hypothetical protein
MGGEIHYNDTCSERAMPKGVFRRNSGSQYPLGVGSSQNGGIMVFVLFFSIPVVITTWNWYSDIKRFRQNHIKKIREKRIREYNKQF